ncbi:hypothetical protein NEOLEDRAFT_1240835 [Neolentinus lepideus HHB14362 ss-1]|uniref:GmrSD restriction endonucleases N-terminal domain-containing protein n=1 Tax=Neolentinus lepideus HHB14362 ss-1 TaxID=1314782 RepID=A0A165TJY9_9AGAM|nr:hypothetical protein NEOLEDRAFT_1240835 [Neolentinus lepideus HHB14362 ss-1]
MHLADDNSSPPGWHTLDQLDDPRDEEEEEEDDEIQEGEFRLPPRLPPRRKCEVTFKQVMDMMDNNRLNLDPPYQRDKVWPEKKQEGLINSFLYNFYIPEIVVSVKAVEGNGATMDVLDGKQRLTTLRSFWKGSIPYKDADGKSWYLVSPLGSKKNVIPAVERSKIEKYVVSLVECHNYTQEHDEDTFRRVQLGMPLTEGEKLAANSSQRSDYIANVIERHVIVGSTKEDRLAPQGERLRAYVDFSTSRGRPFVNVSYLAYVLEGLEEHERWHPTRDQVKDWISRSEDIRESVKADLEIALQRMQEVAANPTFSKDAGFNMERKVAPIEFIFIGVLMHVMRTATPLKRAQAIKGLRLMLGEKHTGQIRLNLTVAKNSWAYVEEAVKGTDDEGNVPAQEVKSHQKRRTRKLQPSPSAGAPPTTPRKKRSRAAPTTPGSQAAVRTPSSRVPDMASGSQGTSPAPGSQTLGTALRSSPVKQEHIDVSGADGHEGSQSAQRRRLGFPTPTRVRTSSSQAAQARDPVTTLARKTELGSTAFDSSPEPPTKKRKREVVQKNDSVDE